MTKKHIEELSEVIEDLNNRFPIKISHSVHDTFGGSINISAEGDEEYGSLFSSDVNEISAFLQGWTTALGKVNQYLKQNNSFEIKSREFASVVTSKLPSYEDDDDILN